MIIILAIMAIVPAFWLLRNIYKQDAIEKEPVSLIAKPFVFGCLCTGLAYLGESAIEAVLPMYKEGTLPYAITYGFLSAALVEELCKFIALIVGS